MKPEYTYHDREDPRFAVAALVARSCEIYGWQAASGCEDGRLKGTARGNFCRARYVPKGRVAATSKHGYLHEWCRGRYVLYRADRTVRGLCSSCQA